MAELLLGQRARGGRVAHRAVLPAADRHPLPLRRHDGVRGLRARAVAELDLVQDRLEHDAQVERRFAYLRLADRWGLRLAVASVERGGRKLTRARS